MKLIVPLVIVLALGACNRDSPPASIPPHPTATELIAMLDSGRITSTEIVTELLRRSNEQEGLHAFITVNAEGALARAAMLDQMRTQGIIQGPLHGLPLVVKDNIHVAGLPNTAGTPGLSTFTPKTDSPVIAVLRDAGVIILGKTNMHELAFGITSDNTVYGAAANPFDQRMFAGGSSGGTASAVAAGIAPADLGTDTGGRDPGAYIRIFRTACSAGEKLRT